MTEVQDGKQEEISTQAHIKNKHLDVYTRIFNLYQLKVFIEATNRIILNNRFNNQLVIDII